LPAWPWRRLRHRPTRSSVHRQIAAGIIGRVQRCVRTWPPPRRTLERCLAITMGGRTAKAAGIRRAGRTFSTPRSRTCATRAGSGSDTGLRPLPLRWICQIPATMAPPERGMTRRTFSTALGWWAWTRRPPSPSRTGFPRHLGIHVGGMLVTRTPLIDLIPIERATMPGRVVTEFDKEDVEALGLVKIDLLSLRTLGVVSDVLDRVEQDTGERPDLDTLPHDDPEVFASIRSADTVGMFQIESRAQMQALPKARPERFEDLVVQVAIIR